jgi:holo-[acyl-carrier protein] synthase
MTGAVGVDLIEVGRVARAVERHGARFLERVFTDAELAYCGRHVAKLAARFAAKEAVAKALGTGIGAVAWREIEVVRDVAGRPGLALHGKAARLTRERGLGRPLLSLSHTREHAIAFVVWECAK